MRRLIRVKRDIVHTIRRAVVSKYAAGALPERARTRIKGFILTLHQENIDFTYRALSVLNTAYCDLMMFLSPIKQKVSKPDRA